MVLSTQLNVEDKVLNAASGTYYVPNNRTQQMLAIFHHIAKSDGWAKSGSLRIQNDGMSVLL